MDAKEMTPNEYQLLAARTDKDRTEQVLRKLAEQEGAITLLHSVIGIVGEVGEICTQLQKWLYYGKEIDIVNLAEEFGDIGWYQAQGVRALKMKLLQIMLSNLAKLKKRFPDEFTDFHAAEENRDRAAEREVLESVTSIAVSAASVSDSSRGIATAVLDYATAVQVGPEPYRKEDQWFDTDPVNVGLVQTGHGFAEPKEEAEQPDEPIDQELLELAFDAGWTWFPAEKDGAVVSSLILEGDKSNHWAAKWQPVTYRGIQGFAPHWLGRRMRELGHTTPMSVIQPEGPVDSGFAVAREIVSSFVEGKAQRASALRRIAAVEERIKKGNEENQCSGGAPCKSCGSEGLCDC